MLPMMSMLSDEFTKIFVVTSPNDAVALSAISPGTDYIYSRQ